MKQVAKVVVDVPVMQTNKPFDYQIPPELVNQLEKGMRVEVPFGPRHIQGFIVDIVDHSSFDGDLKEIIRPLDLEPVLNEELLALGEDMADSVYAFRIHCYQTMLPPVMKAKYEKEFYLTDEFDEKSLEELFEGAESLSWDRAVERNAIPQLLKWRKEGLVDIRYIVKNQAKVKKVKGYRASLDWEQLEEELAGLSKNAKKQKKLLQAIAEREGEVLTAKEFKEQYDLSTQTLQVGVEKKWLQEVEREVYRDPMSSYTFEKTEAKVLNDGQAQAFEQMKAAIDENRHEVFLLKGITGSGKTEVYMQLIGEVLGKGKTALMLVPEIALTPQMVHQFKGRFGENVAVMHSGLSAGEKYDEWRKIKRGEANVVVGARSSIFSPVGNLGIVIIDEEHETTYKQEENPKYHARNVAIHRGTYHQCPVVLGSATPSLESRSRAKKNVYTLLELTERANQLDLPEVQVIDMRDEFQDNNRGNFSRILQDKINDRIAKKEQTVLLLNRRGYSSFIMCRDCGFVLECPNCDISLTFHMDNKEMKCHYCGHQEAVPHHCPKCRSHQFRYYGTGTQKIEKELNQLFPTARIIRMDVDTTRKKGAHEKLLSAFGKGEADILLGTQMIAKGLDFPNVTLVGVINADTSLSLPDFRSSEKTFQLLTQVSGRAGRSTLKGEVVVQTFNPDHYAIRYAQRHNYDGFFLQEMALRHQGGYPPYYFTTQVTVSDLDEKKAQAKIYEINALIRKSMGEQTIVLGPSKSSIAKMNNRYYFQILIKYKKEPHLHAVLKKILDDSQQENAKGLYISIDTEPINFF
ncbi:primosomal protein N' [Jeotgalibaca caeni]|uniref:primosomal protein N' n=1 Tax=Jeotgalibaca caeni TaxID=3028623 RepID=UPI00237DDE15|nr:primosomal protein N' [Jeotgalibaca caeni]MDE1548014.1 primosomal protein N' [Jeotgalibaca caeni]